MFHFVALREAKEKGIRTLAIINAIGLTIAREVGLQSKKWTVNKENKTCRVKRRTLAGVWGGQPQKGPSLFV